MLNGGGLNYTVSPGVCDGGGTHLLCGAIVAVSSENHGWQGEFRSTDGLGHCSERNPQRFDFRSSAPLFLRGARQGRLAIAHEGAVWPERTADDGAFPDSHPLPVHAIEAFGRNRCLGVAPGHRFVIFLLIRRFVCARDRFPVLAPLFLEPLAHHSTLPHKHLTPSVPLYVRTTIGQACWQ